MITATSLARLSGVRAAIRAGRAVPALRTYSTPIPFKEEVDPQLGGYPQLPYVSKQRLPPRGWDDPQMRRNFGDPVHELEDVLGMWGPDIPIVDPQTALRHFTIAWTGILAFALFVKYALVPERPAVPREYPYDGLKEELGGVNQAPVWDESEDEE
ncbi:hypothetical protein OBBRIDRAFT_830935 [Obba rivulosa]|uniref:NADH dehydrogenase [ubiquinone] 1 beta subcomplex subunit 8, mitochondrial n=1 Tax=Obba rivulosa TaxID=1052685 RepID=A0A8E2J5S6_9APHY|nr:hypothetical protein OBBRIDRAFT_830935 [Obba rivulosa]